MEWGLGVSAERNSRLVVKMLEKMLGSGFNKQIALQLVNSNLILNSKDETFATVDACIIDLYHKNAELIKVGACPTYIKRENTVEVVTSESLPVGILADVDINLYNKEIEQGNIIVMCTDGALDSYSEDSDKQAWIRNLLSRIKTRNPQKIADLIVSEAIDNGFGGVKDDVTVIVAALE